ncbi:MAG: hypothetical protein SGPRY_012040 [Prymnesium sp.]
MPKARATRRCGTPGCHLVDGHVGFCSTLVVPSKRKRTPKSERSSGSSTRADPVPEQQVLPSGLHKFYHSQRWGVPLPKGPVKAENSDDEAEEGWCLQQTEQRIRARPEVTAHAAELMTLWNAHVHSAPPIVSDRMLPEVCRHFAFHHAPVLAHSLRECFLSHLFTLWEHNLLHKEDVNDCIVIINVSAKKQCVKRTGKSRAVPDVDSSFSVATIKQHIELENSTSRPLGDSG